jgi:hypothetical protein
VNADELFAALTASGKPMRVMTKHGVRDRLARARQRADSPEVWAEVERRLADYLAYTPPDPPAPPEAA